MDCTEAITAFPLPTRDYTSRDVLIEDLLFIHGTMLASEPLLEHAIVTSTPGPVRDYFITHLAEELNHALWLREDLATIGITPPRIHWRAARLAGTQAYLIQLVHPAMLLGYMAAIECRPASLEQIAFYEQIHGVQLLRTMRYHAEHDRDHGPALLKMIDSLDPATQDLVIQNAAHTAWLLQQEEF